MAHFTFFLARDGPVSRDSGINKASEERSRDTREETLYVITYKASSTSCLTMLSALIDVGREKRRLGTEDEEVHNPQPPLARALARCEAEAQELMLRSSVTVNGKVLILAPQYLNY